LHQNWSLKLAVDPASCTNTTFSNLVPFEIACSLSVDERVGKASIGLSGPSSLASAIGSIGSLTQPVPTITGSQTLRRIDNSVGGVLAFEAAIDMSARFAVVPGVRAVVFSNEGQTVFLTRPEVGVRWTF
jgi:hypothetical protein